MSEEATVTRWLDDDERRAWLRLVAVVELLPGVLERQLRRDADLTHFDYQVLAGLSQAPGRTLRMTALAQATNATPARLSHVVRRLEERGYVERRAADDDARVIHATLTEVGWQAVVAAAPGHVDTVRRHVFDGLGPEQVDALADVMGGVLRRLDPEGRMTALWEG